MRVALRKPLVVGDKPLDALDLNLDALCGGDVDLAAREAYIASGGAPAAVLRLDPGFQVQLAAIACGLSVETLRKCSALDYLAVLQAVQGFLFDSV